MWSRDWWLPQGSCTCLGTSAVRAAPSLTNTLASHLQVPCSGLLWSPTLPSFCPLSNNPELGFPTAFFLIYFFFQFLAHGMALCCHCAPGLRLMGSRQALAGAVPPPEKLRVDRHWCGASGSAGLGCSGGVRTERGAGEQQSARGLEEASLGLH